MTQIARRALRQQFLRADVGITGVNFAIADTGSVVLVTNEGNGRLSSTLPRVHIALMGMEKIIPRLDDLPVMLKVLTNSATGQKISSYVTMITGPRRAHDLDGPEELHVVVMDNGRSDILGSDNREALYCLRCGACLNVCPIYQNIGGHAYGWVYPGPIGAVLTPLFTGLDTAKHLPRASTLCGACREACPVKIDIPHMLLNLRRQSVSRGDARRGRAGCFRCGRGSCNARGSTGWRCDWRAWANCRSRAAAGWENCRRRSTTGPNRATSRRWRRSRSGTAGRQRCNTSSPAVTAERRVTMSAEFWSIIAVGVTVLGLGVAVLGLGWRMYVKLDAKLDAFQAKVDARLTDLDRRLARIEGWIAGRFGEASTAAPAD